jgi:hypothetical protein
MTTERFCVGACQHCGQHIEFPAHGAGATIACPQCAKETVLREGLAEDAAATQEITAAELQEALSGVAAAGRVSILYQVGLFLVAAFMLLLPVAYLAFAGFMGYCVYWYAVHAHGLVSDPHGGGRVMIIRVFLYVAPLIAGVAAVAFMFKPLLAPRGKSPKPMELNPAQHPRLYQFIAHICDMLHVSMPKRIDLHCELNASAGFRRGWLSFFGNDLVVQLGLPLVAGMNTRQLASVVAHELGHCTQAMAMRLYYVIARINGWFMRVIYERDEWDETLDDWSASSETWYVSLLLFCINGAVWLSRRVLWLLMAMGHAVCCFLSRQMEFHADACSMAVVGSEGVESALVRGQELAVLHGLAYESLGDIWKKYNQLPDNFPDFLDCLERKLPPAFHEQARTTLINETSGFFDTHPTAAKRIQKARQRAEAGVFLMEKPARALFRDFDATAKAATGRHYRQALGLPVTAPMLKPVREFIRA